MVTGHTERCGYTYAGEDGHESCCYREPWDGQDRCVFHEEVPDDQTKPRAALRAARAPPEIRAHNRGGGPAELLDGADLRYTSLPTGIDLAGVSLRDVDLTEADAREADLSGADLRDSHLVDADCREATLRGADCWETEMSEVNLRGGDLREADLREADLSDATLRSATLAGANVEGAVLARADLFDATLTDLRCYGTVFSEARADEGTTLDEWCVYDPRHGTADGSLAADGGEASVDRLTKAEGTYQELQSLCAENALLEPQSRYFVRRQDIHALEHRRERHWGRWLRARVSRAVVLYGESPFRVLAAAAAVIVGAALLYPLGYLRTAGGRLLTYPASGDPLALVTTLADSLYFSTLTFTTMTFGLYTPVGPGKFLTMIETSAGIVLMALLVFVFGRRATR